jgi:hypothetical protein
MTRRNFSRLKLRERMHSHGVENVNDAPPIFAPIVRNRRRLTPPSKAALRQQADEAFTDWMARRGAAE